MDRYWVMDQFVKEIESSFLLPNYLDLEFVDDIGELGCAICKRVMLEHRLANCSHKFCSSCAPKFDRETCETRCTKCEKLINNDAVNVTSRFQFMEHWRRVLALRMCCPNKRKGCTYHNQMREVKEHFGDCQWAS